MPSSGYYLALLIFAVIGGTVGAAYRERVEHKAFFLGIGAPALIVAAGTAADARSAGLSLVPVVHAATQVPTQARDSRWITIAPEYPAYSPASAEGDIAVRVDGNWQTYSVGTQRGGLWGASVPPEASEAYFDGSVRTRGVDPTAPYRRIEIRTESVALPAGNSSLRLEFGEAEPTIWVGLLEGFGFRRTARTFVRYGAQISPIPSAVVTVQSMETETDAAFRNYWLYREARQLEVAIDGGEPIFLEIVEGGLRPGQGLLVDRDSGTAELRITIHIRDFSDEPSTSGAWSITEQVDLGRIDASRYTVSTILCGRRFRFNFSMEQGAGFT